ncbi:helix-turn-helix transcriptional regulator [Macrococcoides caseolyticum]|uniref:helix-turn-helix domain-containing protein n=1 Tax=Macrococcoides caseolyticum TaxID=69966 RepID=UPI002D7FDDF9|nr:helix-turn-helix transcriptional regulator [Macrococcus caseolyticus]MCE4958071.1 helix-turn-helix transcriptional regulator [Macrococcus caseolyticus]
MTFGEKIKTEREKRGWSQDQFAERILVSRQSVSKWETNKNYPSIEILIDISDLFKITIDELLRSDENLKSKVIADSKKSYKPNLKNELLTVLGIILAIIFVSYLKNNQLNWISILDSIIATGAVLYLIHLLFPHWNETSNNSQ